MSDTTNIAFVKILIQISMHKEGVIGWWLYHLTEEKANLKKYITYFPQTGLVG